MKTGPVRRLNIGQEASGAYGSRPAGINLCLSLTHCLFLSSVTHADYFGIRTE